MSHNLEPLHQLSLANLQALDSSLRHGEMSKEVSHVACRKLLDNAGDAVFYCLNSLTTIGMLPGQCALLVQAIAGERERAPDPARLFEFVLSGPDVPSVPTSDTVAAVQTLIQEAQEEILLVGYAVHNGARLFEPLALRMKENPRLKVVFYLNIARRYGDTSLSSEIVKRFSQDFRQKHWPWPELPELFYDPRALVDAPDQRASLHAKCVVIDRQAALITSANFTEAAQRRNIEAGMLIRHPPIVERITDYFDGLRVRGDLLRCSLE